MKNLLLACFSVLLLSFTAKGQKGFSAGVNLSPAVTNYTGFYNVELKPTFQFNYGIEGAYRFTHFRLSLGLKHLNQTGKTDFTITTVNNPAGSLGTIEVYYVSRTLAMPIRADYFFNPNSDIQFFAGFGLVPGFVYDQVFESKLFEDGEVEMGAALDEFYFAGSVSLGLQYNLNEAFHLQARPNFLYQVNGPSDEVYAGETITFYTWSAALDISLHYKF